MSNNPFVNNPFLESILVQPGIDTSGFVGINLGGITGQQVALSPQQIAGVVPGDVITSDLMNQILARLTLLEASRVTGILLGPLSENTHTIVALGTGFESGGGIFLDGVSLLAGPVQRGINMVILNPNLNVKFRSAYDTLGAASESTRLINDLQTQAVAQDLVVVATHDAYLGISPEASAALGAVGGAALGTATRGRDNGAFIGVVPTNRANVRFNYLASIIPADIEGFTSARLSALPFVWGIYSIPLKRFLIGGGSNSGSILTIDKGGDKTFDKIVKETDKTTDKVVKETDKTTDKVVKETDKTTDKIVKETDKGGEKVADKVTDKGVEKVTDKGVEKVTDVALPSSRTDARTAETEPNENAIPEDDDASVSAANGRSFIRSEERPDVEQKAIGKAGQPEEEAEPPKREPPKSKTRRKPSDARRRRKSS